MPRKKLTKTAVDNFKYIPGKNPNSSNYLWDNELRGFGIRTSASGVKAFLIRYYTSQKRRRTLTLGNYPVLTVFQARELAQQKLSAVKLGGDPANDKAQALAALSVSELCDIYLERHSKLKKKSWKDDKQRIEKFIKSAFGNRKINSLKRIDVANFHERIGKEVGNATANRVLNLISAMFVLAEKWGHVSEGHVNPGRGTAKLKEISRDRYLTVEEAGRLIKATDAELNLDIRLLIRLYLYTAARKNELLSLAWSDVDFEARRITFRDTKNESNHHIRPAKDVWPLLWSLFELRDSDNPFVFTGRRAGTHLQDIKKPWDRIRERAGLEDIRLHDLRRTAASWLAQAGVNTVAIGKTLNHSNLASMEVYARLSGDDTASAFDKIGEVMQDVEKRATADNN